ncbi:putative glycosyltransferase [Indibacter alkaliphilus LW1]|uniref:Glycosyltransferase n=1 Tax=Indibacter alkaliphilus (strain CCUG 57479 / KCTC 22604 / LW1) TaxID=1189612 RepID=S2D380_INDAL|nr:glycosyltransferase family 2 protein [Indibacter alkaliphilus]EOZ93762.1 putative glycosyltransferase [Indibacter alkaliphilus LW1]
MNLSVTIIIPAYNAVNFLERAVKSALAQDFVKEIIIVEDGSQDDTYQLALQLEQKYDLVQVQTHENRVNKGLAATRNRGLEFASGDWIQVLDADDELMHGKIASQLRIIKPDSTFVVGNSLDIYADGRVTKRSFYENTWQGLIVGKFGISSANLFNRKALASIGGFDGKLRTSEEYDLMFRLMKEGNMPVFDPNYLTKIHITEGSLSRGKQYEEILSTNWINLRKRIRKHLIEKGKFTLFLNYWYSGSVGTFLESFGLPIDETVNKTFLKIYKVEKRLKKRIYLTFFNQYKKATEILIENQRKGS